MGGSDLIADVWSSAQGALGSTTRVDLGNVRDLDLQRYAVAVDGSIDGGAAGLSLQLYLSSVLAWGSGPAEADLLADGNASDPFSGFDVAGLRLMAGGQELQFHRDLQAGMNVVLDVTLTGADLKDTKSGRLLVLLVQRTYSDEHGPLIECRETFLGREALG
ncbi:MaoC family dehydratase N-terminal domain-containing protein [Gordonia sp. LSe1-13]|uniref:MaoC family dehydratase N-terminal domain-containing protein n=1 Tax=Gordonia sesuvii TaxID=3116777 RepID=A0ABU7MIN9_9ACTN|nr:MaoC family dehydratase N-terminal domain-containing protein [Gordonia sp. LSe1-13]